MSQLHTEVRDTVVTFKVTKSEAKAIKKRCKELGVTFSAYIRYLSKSDIEKGGDIEA